MICSLKVIFKIYASLTKIPPFIKYVREVNAARDRGGVRLARRTYGDLCLIPDCANTFLTPQGAPYIEVHHIDFLCDGGEEQIWNLSVVCAHHHRMAHFAQTSARRDLRDLLIRETQARLVRPDLRNFHG